jgi:hypothetical protein
MTQYFLLLSGRWFSAASLKGAWHFVAADKLPADFANIPPGSDKGHLLVSFHLKLFTVSLAAHIHLLKLCFL